MGGLLSNLIKPVAFDHMVIDEEDLRSIFSSYLYTIFPPERSFMISPLP